MNKITLSDLHKAMTTFNSQHPEKQDQPLLSGVIVYKASSFTKPYTETERSYRVYNNNRQFQSGMISNSLFGSCLDGTDDGVRLDWYKWSVDYCYLETSETA